jgi:hypothetical protein
VIGQIIVGCAVLAGVVVGAVCAHIFFDWRHR